MAEQLLYLTELLGLKVHGLNQRVLGRVSDAALVPVAHPVRIDRLFIGGAFTWLTVRQEQIHRIGLDGIFLSDENLTPYHPDESMLRLERDLLDQQIIDAQGRKVVRVNDVTFEVVREDGHDVLLIREVDIGLRSVFRRLAQGVLPRRMIRRLQSRIAPNSIGWEYCSIIEPDPQRRLRLNISTSLIEKMRPADLADIVEELSPDDREALFTAMEADVAAEALSEVDPDIQAQIIESLETERAADILEEMDPDEAADVLGDLEERMSEEILEEMEDAPKAEVEELLEYDEDTAGGLMNTEFVAVHDSATAGDAIEAVRSQPDMADGVTTLFLTDIDGRLTGVIPATRALLARPDASVAELSPEEPVTAHVADKAARVAELFDKYNLLALPVVDDEGRMAGVVTADDIITLLRRK
ncbi:MAG TPA: CBS domain-containing protein [Bryobacteraceae bacterium]|nr:CBS domain-containing protein [Bryobacteraceae bacterium]HPT27971.1 CBS domain-containing protein [Bryobacteraceae bacterium]